MREDGCAWGDMVEEDGTRERRRGVRVYLGVGEVSAEIPSGAVENVVACSRVTGGESEWTIGSHCKL